MAQQLPLLDTRFDRSDIRPTPARTARRTARARNTALAAVPDRADVLVEIPAVDWRIDQHTKEVGLAGVAAARQALAAAVGRAAA